MSEIYSLIIYSDEKEIVKKIDASLYGTNFKIKGISSQPEEIKTLLRQYAPDFMIINLTHICSNPNIHPLKIASPRTRIIITKEICESINIFELIQGGADSFLPIPFTQDELKKLLTQLVKDEIFFPPFVAKAILSKAQDTLHPGEQPFVLTDKDKSVLWCLSKDMNLNAIEESLGIEQALIKAHLTNILQKIHFSNIIQSHFNEKLLEVKSSIDHYELI